ncbi:protein disulfide-isomerase precursor [Tilletia horrida]|uniref:Protein disulfide-isomerase n=1 Tax=Tilletia horrida TaxID=155126 RepID=A0AAN6GL89_9BASI|nr:protein disulfide-isomerase precursor [Tilletia horrida]KAK0566299.1 protein disulfide-isomerase precursor [Tilletia horrida]
MRVPNRSSVFAAAAAAAALCVPTLVNAQDDGPDDVLVLTNANWTQTVEAHPLTLLEFYAPWCGHCKNLAPEYKIAATKLKAEGIPIAKIDCTEETELCSKVGVAGYPTLKIFRGNTESSSEYAGPRKADGIVSYMIKQNQPAVSHLTSAGAADKLKQQDKVVAIAYVSSSPSAKETAALDAFKAAANNERDSYTFGYVDDAELAKAAGVTSFPSIIIYRSFDEPELTLPISDSTNAGSIESFIKDASVPLIDEVGPENFRLYADAGLPIVYYFTERDDPKKDDILAELKPVAKEFKGKVNFVWIDAVKFAQHAESLNLQTEVWPAAAIQDLAAHTKFPLAKLGSNPASAIKTFVTDFTTGKLQPSIKSEPVPASQNEGVFTLVADEFDKIANDHTKDLLVEFYAPWCGHCKKLEPTYAALGEKYASHKDKIIIAKMDATKNDIPPSAGFSVQGFPTIKFRPAGPAQSWIDFNGERSLEGFVEFIGLNGKNKLDAAADNSTGGASKPVADSTKESKAPAEPQQAEGIHDEL